MASVLEAFQMVAESVAAIGTAAKMSAAALAQASEAQDRFVESTARAETTSAMGKADSTSPTALGLALQTQTGRR
jgi:hypothetical protein